MSNVEIFKKKFVDISTFVIWGDGPVEGKKARFILSFRDGKPRFTVYTGVTGKDGVISFPADIATATYFLSVLKEIANGVNGSKMSIDSLTSIYENDKPTLNKKLVSTLHVGKSAEGIVYIAMISENRPKVVFEIKPDEYHLFKDKDGNKVDDTIVSSRMAAGMADLALNVISDVMTRHAIEDIRPQTSNNVNNNYPVVTPSNTSITSLDDIPY